MAESIQPPDPDRFRWERHTAVAEPLLAQPFPRAANAPTEGCPSRCRARNAGRGGEDRASMSSRGLISVNPGSTSGDNFGGESEPRRAERASNDAGSRQSFWLVIAAAAAAEGMATSSSVSSATATSPLEQVRSVGYCSPPPLLRPSKFARVANFFVLRISSECEQSSTRAYPRFHFSFEGRQRVRRRLSLTPSSSILCSPPCLRRDCVGTRTDLAGRPGGGQGKNEGQLAASFRSPAARGAAFLCNFWLGRPLWSCWPIYMGSTISI